MTLQEAIVIAKRTIEGKASIEERNALRAFIESYPDQGKFIEDLFPIKDWEEVQSLQSLPAGMEGRVLEKVLDRRLGERRGVIRHFTRIAAAAAIIGICLISGVFLVLRRHSASSTAPKVVMLSTQDGQVKSVVLEDGTHILLNGGTTLRIPENFAGGVREVFLDGEAFFDVSKDSLRPFIIHSPRVSTTVLGTSFSLRSASKELVSAVAVATGKVRVEVDSSKTGVFGSSGSSPTAAAGTAFSMAIVTPGQEAVYRSGDSAGILKKQVNIAAIGVWKDHCFYYDHNTLKEILADLERAYGLHFRVKDESVLKYTYVAAFKNISSTSILQTLTLMGHVSFKKNGDFIEVNGIAGH